MKTVKVEVTMRHANKHVGDTYEVSAVKAKALEGIGLVKPANVTAERKIAKVGTAE